MLKLNGGILKGQDGRKGQAEKGQALEPCAMWRYITMYISQPVLFPTPLTQPGRYTVHFKDLNMLGYQIQTGTLYL